MQGGGRAESATPHHPSLHHSPPPSFKRRRTYMCTDLVLVFLTHLAHTSPHAQRAIGPSHPPPHLSNAGARLCTHGRRIDALAPSLADRAAHGLVTTLHRLTCLVVMAMVTARTRACVGCATAVGECTEGESRISYTASPIPPPLATTNRYTLIICDRTDICMKLGATTRPAQV